MNVMKNGSRIEVQKTYKIYIGGAFPRTESGRYYKLKDGKGNLLANVCQGSRKDFRTAVQKARGAFPGWSGRAHFNRSQILYRIAEMLEGRRDQFVAELKRQGSTANQANAEVNLSVERLVYYAGWADKYQQIFSAVNPVASSHFNFSMLEPMGVVSILAPEDSSLIGLVSTISPIIVGGNTAVVLASENKPLSAITFAEVLHSSDVPGGVVNIITGFRNELLTHYASHMDVNAVVYTGDDREALSTVRTCAVDNLKRVIDHSAIKWSKESAQSPYMILDAQETKTTWHPIGV